MAPKHQKKPTNQTNKKNFRLKGMKIEGKKKPKTQQSGFFFKYSEERNIYLKISFQF